jgi:16S rRNA (guanine527-N7)-methyltransferase
LIADIRERAHLEWPGLSTDQLVRIQAYYERLVTENEIQNLTRLSSPEDFIEGHLIDVRELLKTGFLEYPAADLGSGAGVPGLLAAAIEPARWLLIESERQKARFLQETATALGLSTVQVFAERGESVLKQHSAKSVVARAVGPVDRIFGWLKSSTWNKLILLKGPKWEEEWSSFQRTGVGKKLRLTGSHAYEVGKENKRRLIVCLERVPRGT